MTADRRIPRVLALIATLVVAMIVADRALDVPAASTEEREHTETAVTVENGRVTLRGAAAANAGVRLAVAADVAAPPEVDAFGRVLDPLPLVEALHARAAARATAAAARAEYERVTRLHRDDQNASTRDLEAARVASERAALDAVDAAARAAIAWGAAVETAAAAADDLVAGRAALVRIDLPSGVRLASMPAHAVVTPIGAPDAGRTARVLGPAATTDPQLQGDAYLALVDHDPPRPGAVLAVKIARDDAPSRGVAVPVSAIVWADAKPVVYVEVGPNAFARRDVTLGFVVGDQRLVGGVAAGERVVSAGAAQLLSAEVLAATPAED